MMFLRLLIALRKDALKIWMILLHTLKGRMLGADVDVVGEDQRPLGSHHQPEIFIMLSQMENTNNVVEALHSKLKKLMIAHHPSI